MSSRRTVGSSSLPLLLGVLVGGGLMAVTPAGAEVSNALATNWKKIWNKELKPQADQRYYTKKKSNKRYYTKSDSDAKYQPRAATRSTARRTHKAESDVKYSRCRAPASHQGRERREVRPSGRHPRRLGDQSDSAARPAEITVSRSPAAPRFGVIPVRGAPAGGLCRIACRAGRRPGNLCIFRAPETPTALLTVTSRFSRRRRVGAADSPAARWATGRSAAAGRVATSAAPRLRGRVACRAPEPAGRGRRTCRRTSAASGVRRTVPLSGPTAAGSTLAM